MVAMMRLAISQHPVPSLEATLHTHLCTQPEELKRETCVQEPHPDPSHSYHAVLSERLLKHIVQGRAIITLTFLGAPALSGVFPFLVDTKEEQ